MFHRSERLFLRPAWPEDWQNIAESAAISDSEQTGAGGAKARECYHAPRPSWRKHQPMSRNFLLTLPGPKPGPNGQSVIGWAALLGERERDVRKLGMKLWVAPDYRGRGFGRECLQALLNIAAMLRSRTIYTLVPDEERAAIRMVEKAGFRSLTPLARASQEGAAGSGQFPALVAGCSEVAPPATLYACDLRSHRQRRSDAPAAATASERELETSAS